MTTMHPGHIERGGRWTKPAVGRHVLFVVTVTDGGFAKRTSIDEYRIQGRGGLGIRVAKLPDDRGHLVGAAVVEEGDELLVVMEKGRVVRSRVAEVPPKGRTTMGVTFAKPYKGDQILLVTTTAETEVDDEEVDDSERPDLPEAGDAADAEGTEAAAGPEGEDSVETASSASPAEGDDLLSEQTDQTDQSDAADGTTEE